MDFDFCGSGSRRVSGFRLSGKGSKVARRHVRDFVVRCFEGELRV